MNNNSFLRNKRCQRISFAGIKISRKRKAYKKDTGLILRLDDGMMTKENDVVLIYLEDQPISFARIEDISPDLKKDWYLVKLLLFQMPLQVVTWILRDIYINGQEFTMEGKKIRLEKVVCPKETGPVEKEKGTPQKPSGKKVISLADLKKKSS